MNNETGESGEAAPDDDSIDGITLLVRCGDTKFQQIVNDDDGRLRPPSALFHYRERRDNGYLSVYFENRLKIAGHEPGHLCQPSATSYVALVSVDAVRQIFLGVKEQPELHAPFHGGIWGFAPLTDKDRKRKARKLAKSSRFIDQI